MDKDEFEREEEDEEFPEIEEVLEVLVAAAHARGAFVMTGTGTLLQSVGEVNDAPRIPLTSIDAEKFEKDCDARSVAFNTTPDGESLPALALTALGTGDGWYLVGIIFNVDDSDFDSIQIALRHNSDDLICALEEVDEGASNSKSVEKISGREMADIVDRGLTQVVMENVSGGYATRLESILDSIDAIAKDPADANYVGDYLPALSAALDSFQDGVHSEDTEVMDAVSDLNMYATSLTPDAIARSGLAPLRVRLRTLLDACSTS